MSTEPKPDPSPDVKGMAARRAALKLVEAGLERRGGMDEALQAHGFLALSATERAWARGLAATVFRRLGPIDQALQARLASAPPAAVTDLLRLGAGQLLYRDTPAHAAVATTVSMAEEGNGTRPFKGLINAVLRRLADAPPEAPSPDAHLPPWLFARWRAAYGETAALALAAAVPLEPPTDLTPKDAGELDALAELLEAEVLPGGSLRVRRRGEITGWPGFAEGRWWVQDVAAALPARLLHAKPGEIVLDLCAAPGGKTLQLAATGAQVTALDRSAARLKRLKANLTRMGLKADAQAVDVFAWADRREFDAVLLDAPCSATGTFRRHPDVLWGAKPSDIAKLAETQGKMLDAAAARVKPGGRLVYCVCSLEPEEGEGQVAPFLARNPGFALAPVAAGEAGTPAEALAANRPGVRLTPSLWEPQGGMDGFFIARFVRAEQTSISGA
jgi:16S rRNA (cytosine967-C5)-methyltransferase